MILFELTGSEAHPIYQDLEVSNGNRQYDFLRSIVGAAVAADKRFISQHVIKALNFQAITCLHTNPGEFRPCEVTVGSHTPPAFFQVQALMDDFVNTVNRSWETSDPVVLAAYVLWRLNFIHPFINGNGRTARAACYFVLCISAGYWLPGTTILPELIKRDRAAYVMALEYADKTYFAGKLDLSALHSLLVKLLTEQMASAGIPTDSASETSSASPDEPVAAGAPE